MPHSLKCVICTRHSSVQWVRRVPCTHGLHRAFLVCLSVEYCIQHAVWPSNGVKVDVHFDKYKWQGNNTRSHTYIVILCMAGQSRADLLSSRAKIACTNCCTQWIIVFSRMSHSVQHFPIYSLTSAPMIVMSVLHILECLLYAPCRCSAVQHFHPLHLFSSCPSCDDVLIYLHSPTYFM